MVEIGRYFYEKYKDNPPQELEKAFGDIKILQESIAISRGEIQNLEASMAARKQS